MKKTLITNGTLVTAADTFKADLLIVDGTIAAVGQSLPADGAEVVDASGLYVLPGGIDVHTHLDLPFGGTVASDDFYTGHRAAAFGGTTCTISPASAAAFTSATASPEFCTRQPSGAVSAMPSGS